MPGVPAKLLGISQDRDVAPLADTNPLLSLHNFCLGPELMRDQLLKTNVYHAQSYGVREAPVASWIEGEEELDAKNNPVAVPARNRQPILKLDEHVSSNESPALPL